MKEDNIDLRFEKKFIIPYSSKDYVKHILLSNKLRFTKQYIQRNVNSIYFDDPKLTSFNENIDGISIRKKYRIRWYGSPKKIVDPILEIKKKNNNLGSKYLHKINSKKLNNIDFAIDKLTNILKEENLPSSFYEEIRYQEPTLFVSYRRNYYKSKIINCRMTFDEDIKYLKLNSNSIFNLKSHKKDEYMIMELKYPQNIQNTYFSFLLNIPFRLSKNSKYINGIIKFIDE